MLTLRLLGNATLQNEQGSLSGRAVQPRRLALLALLALAPRKSLSRDKLIAFLWPESDTEQGRHLLSVAVYELRKAVGDTLVTARDDVMLNSDGLAIDVDEFVAACDAGDFRRAVTLHGGPLLDGFHINDAPDFEHWLTAQRAHLERRYGEALQRDAQARSAAGDPEGAVAAWRRLSDHDPYSARVACGLMQALDAAGDRAGALRHARSHAALMRQEFGAEADPEVTQLADRLKRAPREGASVPAPIVAAGAGARSIIPPPAEPPSSPLPSTPPSSTVLPSPRHRRWWVGGALLLAAAAGFGWWRARAAPSPSGSESATIAIAVLPFANLSPTDTASVFSDGVTEEIISALSRVPSLSVVSRNSSFVFRGDVDTREVARRLNVGHVLEGTVRMDRTRVRVAARLIDAGNGYEVWSEVYDNPLDMQNVMTIQENIARAVVTELAARFDRPLDLDRAGNAPTDDVEAFELFVAGKRFFHRRTVPDLQRAAQLYDRAIERDPNYALSHAGRAEVYALLGAYDYGALPPERAFTTARASAERALALEPELAEAHSALASVRFNYDWDWTGAEQEYRRAIQLSPGYATARHWYSLLLIAQGRPREAFDQIMRARELDPLSSVTSAGLARHYYLTRELDRAIAGYQSTLAADSTFVTAYVGLGLSQAAKGDYDAAIRSYESASRMLGQTPPLLSALIANAHGRAGRSEEARKHVEALGAAEARVYVPAEYRAVAHIGMGDADAAFEAFFEAVANRSAGVVYLDVEPLVDPIRSDPRFADLLARVGISGR